MSTREEMATLLKKGQEIEFYNICYFAFFHTAELLVYRACLNRPKTMHVDNKGYLQRSVVRSRVWKQALAFVQPSQRLP